MAFGHFHRNNNTSKLPNNKGNPETQYTLQSSFLTELFCFFCTANLQFSMGHIFTENLLTSSSALLGDAGGVYITL